MPYRRAVSLLAAALSGFYLGTGSASAGEPAPQKNLALGAPYGLSRPALYALTHDEADERKLTDGKLAPDNVWRSKATVGWMADDFPITIEVDLGAEQPVGRICMRSARGAPQGVSFPRRVDMFLSADRSRYAWAGRLTPLADGGAGDYQAREFCSGDLGRQGRYVRLQVAPQGTFFFTDEVFVWESGHNRLRQPSAMLASDELKDFAIAHEATSRELSALTAQLAKSPSTEGAKRRLAQIAAALQGADTDLDLARLRAIDADIRAVARDVRRAAGRGPVQLVRADPWQFATPLDGAALAGPAGELEIQAGGHGVAAVAIDHIELGTLELKLSARVSGNASALTATPYEVAFVTRADGVRLGDPLLPIEAGRISLPAGETHQVWLDIAAAPGAGHQRAVVELEVEANTANGPVEHVLRIPILVYTLPGPRSPLATNVWGYLDPLPVRDRPAAAAVDMLAHGVNTAVIPSWHYLPWPKPNAAPGDHEIGDYTKFDEVMTTLAGYKRHIFFLAFNNDSDQRSFHRQHQFLSEGWQKLLVAWIAEWSGRLRAAGHSYDSFAFYPVDEPHLGFEQDALLKVARLIKQADPKLRVYTTLDEPKVLTDEFLDTIDIVQLNGRALLPEIVARVKAKGKSAWSYLTIGGGKRGNPALFYRAQAWDAFSMGLTGLGFWSYADTGVSGTAWNDIDGTGPDFAAVYDGRPGHPAEIISSKRWEAFRESVQDYELMWAALNTASSQHEKSEVLNLIKDGRGKIGDFIAFSEVRRRLLEHIGYQRVRQQNLHGEDHGGEARH